MKKFRNHSARASALQVTMAIAALAVSAILLAANFKAAPANEQSQSAADPADPAKAKIAQVEAEQQAAVIEKAKQTGFYPPLPEKPAPGTAPADRSDPIVFGPGCSPITFPGTGVGAIPDGLSGTPPQYGPPLVISFAVSGLTAPLSVVSTNLTLTHSWCGDLDMVLAAPSGAASIITVSRIGVVTATSFGTSTDFNGTYNFADTAVGPNIWTAAVTNPVPPGTYRTTAGGGAGQTNPAPVTNLTAAFAGLSTAQVNGTWTLTIRDAGAADTGTVTAANLTLSGPGCATPTPAPTASPVPTAAPSPVPCNTYTNATGITILDSTGGSPYPSNIPVSGLGGTVTFVGIRINGITHTFPDDIDIMLVGPGGQTAVVMSDAGGSTAVVGVNLSIYDLAVTPIPDAGPLVSGSFAPTNIDATDVFPAPAPAIGGSSMGVFNGTNPNGTWSLYVSDDAGGDTGTITSWDLLILTTSCGGPTATPNPTGTPSPTATVSPTPAPTGTPTPTAGPTGTPPATVCTMPTEDFANISTLVPAGWVMKNNSSPLGLTGWSQGSTIVFNSQAGAPTAYISANYNNTGSIGTISNWLLTPPVTIQNGAQLSFWTQAADGTFPDRLQVRMSTSGTSANVGALATDVGDFTTLLLDINPTYTASGYPVGTWQNFLITISGVGSPVKGRLAFRYFVENAGATGLNSDYIGIDTVSYSCTGGQTPAPTGTPTATPTATLTPTPPPTPTATPCPISSTVLSQDFEAGLGAWTTTNLTTGSACPANVDWIIRPNPYDPSSAPCGGSAGQTPLNSGGGTSFAMTDADAGGSGVAVDTALNSPSFNTVGMSTLRLSFRHFYRDLGTTDNPTVQVSTAGAGGPWTTVKTYPATQGAAAAFVADSIVLDAFVGNVDTRIRFHYTAGWDWWWAIDDIVLTTCSGGTVSISGKVGNCSSPAPTATPPALPTPPVLPGSPNVLMTLSGSSSGTTLTDGSGNYSFTVNSGGTYTVTPSKTAIPPAGPNINNLDVLAVQRHFLFISIIPAGCRLTAADANVNGSVNSQDVLAIQRFFLGFTSGIGSVGQYKFIPASRNYPAIGGNQTAQDYAMYVVGDAAATFNNRPGGNENEMGFSSVAFVALPDVAPSRTMSNFAAPVTTSAVDASERFVGFQGDFTFDERAVKFANEPVEKAGLTGGNWNVAGNVLPGNGPIRTLRISAYSNDFSPLSGAGTLFMLKMVRVSQSGEGTPLVWSAPPDNFIFINADLQTQRPGDSAVGSVSASMRDR